MVGLVEEAWAQQEEEVSSHAQVEVEVEVEVAVHRFHLQIRYETLGFVVQL